MPYATAQDMLDRIDTRWLCQLVFDNNTVATTTQFQASTRVADALADASGYILTSALQGKRYSKADLAGLTGDSLSFLTKLTCDIAAAFLAEARQLPSKDIAENVPGYGRALQFLEALRLGNQVFDVDANEDAGLPHTQRTCSGVVTRAVRLFGDIGNPSPCCRPGPCDPCDPLQR